MEKNRNFGTSSAGRSDGFTMMELLIAIAVLVILGTLAVPSFIQTIQNNRISGQANELVASTQLARSEAIKRGVEVRVCSSDDGASCSGGFADGWIVIADPDDAAEVVRVYPPPGDSFNFNPAAGGVSFTPNGFSEDAVEVALLVSANNCSGDNARRILVERTGRVSSQRANCP